MGGSVFSVGLILVVIAGGELFTGNCLLLSAVMGCRVRFRSMLRNWFFVYISNFVGAIFVVAIIFYGGLWKLGDMGVGAAALKTAVAKVDLTFGEAFFRGVGCNWLVCLAVWMAVASKDVTGKILAMYFPVMAFVASGFEHSIANMYFIPMGILLKSNALVVSASGLGDGAANLTWRAFLVNNLVPVTLGNIVGGAIFVGGAYYLAYLKPVSQEPSHPDRDIYMEDVSQSAQR
jgi:formate/nitrite transporter